MARKTTTEFSNFQIVTLATFLIGGATSPADIEDIAVIAARSRSVFSIG